MIRRTIERKLLELKNQFPILAILGPRQSGKTTLARTLFPNYRSDYLKKRYHHGLPPNVYFWRDKSGNEIDCLLEEGSRLSPVEIKSSATIQSDMFSGLEKWCGLAQIQADSGTVIYAGDEEQKRAKGRILSWKKL